MAKRRKRYVYETHEELPVLPGKVELPSADNWGYRCARARKLNACVMCASLLNENGDCPDCAERAEMEKKGATPTRNDIPPQARMQEWRSGAPVPMNPSMSRLQAGERYRGRFWK